MVENAHIAPSGDQSQLTFIDSTPRAGGLYLSSHFTLMTMVSLCGCRQHLTDADPEGWRVRPSVGSHGEGVEPGLKLKPDRPHGPNPTPHCLSADMYTGLNMSPRPFLFWLHWVFVATRRLSLVVASGGCSSLRCAGFSLCWLLLLRSMGSRCTGFSSCGTWAQ